MQAAVIRMMNIVIERTILTQESSKPNLETFAFLDLLYYVRD